MTVLGLCCCAGLFSSWGEQGLLSRCGVRASHCGGFSRFGAQALGHRDFSSCSSQALSTGLMVVAHGLTCSAARGIFPEQELNLSPALAGRLSTTAPLGKPWWFSNCIILSVFQLAFSCKKELVLSLHLCMYSFISIIRALDCILLSSDPLLSNISIAKLSQIWSVGDHLSCVVLLRLCRSLSIFLFSTTGRYCSLILYFTCPTPGISQFARVLVLFRAEWYSEVSIWMSAVLIAIGVSLYPGILGGHS